MACQKEQWFGKLGRVGNTELRQERNIGIICITLASRAAIRGGVLPEKAFSMADQFILNLEQTEEPEKIKGMVLEYEREFLYQVQQVNGGRGNYYIRAAKDYIYKHLHQKIRISDIAEVLRIHSDYLSMIFRKYEGIALSRYILMEKIGEAQYLLRYTEKTINQIAVLLAFSSQSYFGKCFRDFTGYSPAEYRNRFKEIKHIQEF